MTAEISPIGCLPDEASVAYERAAACPATLEAAKGAALLAEAARLRAAAVAAPLTVGFTLKNRAFCFATLLRRAAAGRERQPLSMVG